LLSGESSRRIVVVGGGHAGGQMLDALRKEGFDGELILLAEEPQLPYQRPPLSKKYLAGELALERLLLRPPAYFEKLDVQTRLGQPATAIHRDSKQLQLADGSAISYDQLALTTGARVRRLPIENDHLKGVHYLRTLSDVDAIREDLTETRSVVIVGGGFIGLEAAAVLRKMGKEVTVLEMQERLMPRVVAPVIGRFIESCHDREGVNIVNNACVRAIDGNQHGVQEVVTVDGTTYPAQLVIVGIGVLPNTELAEAAGLACEDGIVVDDFAATQDPDIVAAGDCTRHPNPLLGGMIRLESVHNALEQAKTAAATLCGHHRPYHQIPWFWSDQYQFKLQMVGISDGHDQHVIRGDLEEQKFTVFYFGEGQLIGVDTVNSPGDHMAARKLLAQRSGLTPEQAADEGFDLGSLIQR
jgi:3-phenylpropionate/trans-cinnamate dioxygenase ferredoxin reductase subunit